jgi:hypothetical protein
MSEILRPDGDVSVSLTPSAAVDHYTLLDESTLNTDDYVSLSSPGADNGSAGGSDTLSCGTFTKGTITSIVGWFNIAAYIYAATSGAEGSVTITYRLYKGATQLATDTTIYTAVGNQGGWVSVTYTGDLTQSELDDLRLYIAISAHDSGQYTEKGWVYYGNNGYCYMAYAEVIGGGWTNIKNIRAGTGSIASADVESIWVGTSQVAVADIAEMNRVAV